MSMRLRHLISFLLIPMALTAQTRRAAPAPVKVPEPTGPIAVFDTTMGRITCRLYDKQAPKTVANFIALAQGTKPWRDHMNLVDVKDTPFYDGTAIAGITNGIRGGDRFGGGEGAAGEPIQEEKIPGVNFERGGRLAMATHAEEISSSFYTITLQPDAEFDANHLGAIFGQCDDAGVEVAAKISHAMMIVGNRTDKAIALNKLTIVQPGQPLPPVAADVDPKKVVPQPVPPTLSTMPVPQPTGPTAVIDTTMGTLTCKLFTQQAPIATSTFIEMAEGTREWTNSVTHVTSKKPFYNGLHINRVLPDFMVQQQDYPSEEDGAGFTYSIEPVPGLEFDRPGRLAMANGGPNKNDTSWFVTDTLAHQLDNKFTIFGQCDDASINLVHEMARVPKNAHNRPLTPITVKNVTIQR
jgi:cyclophilin family peptidyl-prolyl cis-trans isomerase